MKKAKPQQEADNKNKAGTAWSHSYLNQKPWHPLSYPNQRRKWIAEQTQAQKDRKAQEVAREYSQEQEFFRQSALLSKKEQEKAEAMQALSFMYMRPPGYNAESARAAELADERKNECPFDVPEPPLNGHQRVEDVRPKPRVLDIYGRPVPTEAEFPALKNAPRLETGTVARAKPFAVEIRNVKCARCGTFGHQSGDRECAMKDIIMPNEQARLKRDDPLTAMMAATSEGNKWELKQPLGALSPPRGGFRPDDPNQQILAGDIDDEYGGFLGDGENFASMIASSLLKKDKKSKKEKKKKKRRKSASSDSSSEDESDRHSRKKHRDSGEHRSRRSEKEDRHGRHKTAEDDGEGRDADTSRIRHHRDDVDDDRHHKRREKTAEVNGEGRDADSSRDRHSRHHRDDEDDDRHRRRREKTAEDDGESRDADNRHSSRHHRDDDDDDRHKKRRESRSRKELDEDNHHRSRERKGHREQESP